MGTHLLEGDLQLPAQDEPLNDLVGWDLRISTQQGLWLELPKRVSD
jgi:hypothetical protein